MNDYLTSMSGWNASPGVGVWNPQINPLVPPPSIQQQYALSPAVDNSAALTNLSQPLPGQVGDPGLWERFKSSGVFGSSSIDPKTGARLTDQGWGMPALQAGLGLFNAWMGMKQYGLAKDSFNENKRQFGLNFDAQKQTTNSALEDRQRARVASNPSAYQSVGDYMAQNGIRG